MEAVLLDTKLPLISPLQITPYGFSTESILKFHFNGEPFEVAVEPNSLITVVWSEAEIYAIEEETFTDNKKARLKLFNTGEVPLSLKTADGKTVVIDAVEDRHYGYRDINALKVPFAFYQDDTQVLATDPIVLQRGQTTSLFYLEKATIPLYLVIQELR